MVHLRLARRLPPADTDDLRRSTITTTDSRSGLTTKGEIIDALDRLRDTEDSEIDGCFGDADEIELELLRDLADLVRKETE